MRFVWDWLVSVLILFCGWPMWLMSLSIQCPVILISVCWSLVYAPYTVYLHILIHLIPCFSSGNYQSILNFLNRFSFFNTKMIISLNVLNKKQRIFFFIAMIVCKQLIKNKNKICLMPKCSSPRSNFSFKFFFSRTFTTIKLYRIYMVIDLWLVFFCLVVSCL